MTQHGNLQKHTNANPLQQYLLTQFHQKIINTVQMVKPQRMLDAGCGEGFTGRDLRAKLPDLNMVGVDLSASALQWNQQEQMSQAPLGQSDLYWLPFPDNYFDLVMCLEVLEHLPSSATGLRELLRVSSKFVLLSVPHEPFFRGANFLRGKHVSALGNDPEHLHNYSGAEFRRLVSAQAEVLWQSYQFPWQIVLARK